MQPIYRAVHRAQAQPEHREGAGICFYTSAVGVVADPVIAGAAERRVVP